jgi:IclR family mhp operon transcriptional activator
MAGTRAIQRALLVLRLMNEQATWTLAQLHERTGLPKSTLHRLLLTLQQEHYVRSDESMYGSYGLTSKVHDLSCGVTDKSALVDAAAPVLIATTKQIKWPLTMGVPDGYEIRVNFCAMPYSPYAIRATSYGRRYGVLTSALGKAYLAYCTPQERRILVEMSARDEREPLNLRSVRQAIRGTRRLGFGVRYANDPKESDAFAVPIICETGILGALAYSTFAGIMTDQIIERFLPVLNRTAQEIGARFDHARIPGGQPD